MKKWFIICSLVTYLTACSDEGFHPSIFNTEEENMTELDRWVIDNFTLTHNIEVIYHWDDFESDQSYILVPPQEKKVEPFLRAIKTVWINPYIEVGGPDFFNTYCPKQIMLVGSAGYNNDGTYLLGQAEGGNKITLYNLNMSEPSEENTLLSFARNFHHEFAHIFHQNVELPEAYELVTADVYTENWTSISQPISQGLISAYAGADADEDFAEMVAWFVLRKTDDWNQIVNNNKKLKEKETIMLNYMKSVWGIDMYLLREKVQKGINDVLLGNY